MTTTTRRRNGTVEYLYGGYVSWYNDRLGRRFEKTVHVWGPVEWDPTYYGDGSEIHEAIEAKARKRWPEARCQEAWKV